MNMTIQGFFALFGALAAMCTDVSCGKVFNKWILFLYAAGLSLQLYLNGPPGLYAFLAGAAVPMLLLFPLFIFRMIGGGDVKLLSAIGGIIGSTGIQNCFLWSLVFGAVISLMILLYDASSAERMRYFLRYLKGTAAALQAGKTALRSRGEIHFRPYLVPGERPENFHFTVPVFMSVMLYAGGLI
jgi:prepilin peptidase CpaA